jgi:hypothetical protein
MKIWVDDIRPKPDASWLHARNSYEAIRALEIYRGLRNGWLPTLSIEAVSLDHDLGGDDTTRPVVLWMCENDFWPENIYVHTDNPVGREWLVGMVERYGPGVRR